MRKSYVYLFCGLLIVGVFVLCDPVAIAQVNRATVTGTVTDSTGAVVPGVEVTATNAGTNVPTKTVSNQDGIYVIPNLFPGPYSVEFKKEGFESLVRPAITLESTQVARIDAQLKVGSVAQTMTVTAEAPMLDLERPSIGTNMKSSVVNDLPLSIYGGGRSIEDFAVALTPGYSPISGPYTSVINGGQYFTKEYTVDGTSGTANIQGDSGETGPSAEAVEELQAQTSGLDAQSAVTGGGVIQFNLKSGTNKIHGSAFGYGVNEFLGANTWTNDYYGIRKPKKRAWEYGFSVGGPVIKDKTFFFGAFERFDHTNYGLNSGSTSVPTASMLNGDFHELLLGNLCNADGTTGLCSVIGGTLLDPVPDTQGKLVQPQAGMIYDWVFSDICPAFPCAYANNTIPQDHISPVSQRIVALYKDYAPQFGGLNNNARGLIDNSPHQTPTQFVIKLDHVLREQDRLSGSWIYNNRPRTLVDGGGVWQAGTTTGGPLANARYQTYSSHQVRLSESHTFTPRFLNVVNFTYNWDFNSSRSTVPGNWNEQLGFGDTGSDNFPVIGFDDGTYNYNGYSETFLGSAWQGKLTGATIIAGDTATWTKGRHNFSFGGDFKAHQINNTSPGGALSYGFTQLTTSGADYHHDGFAFASFLEGVPQNKSSESVPFSLYGRQKSLFLYAQDSYKMTPKLTLSMGVRWNFNFRFHEKNGNWANYDLTAIDPTYNLPGKLEFAKNGSDSFYKNQYWKQFGPSFGFAYQMHPKTVVRGSFGLIFNPVGVTFFGGVPDGFAPQFGLNETRSIGPDGFWHNPDGSGRRPDNFFKVTPSSPLPEVMQHIFPLVVVDPRALQLGYSEAFNFGIQQELTPSTRLEISYVGNRGHHLTDTALAWNQGTTSEFLRLVNMANTQPDYYYGYALPLATWNHWVCDAGAAAYYGVSYPTSNQFVYGNYCGSVLGLIAPSPQTADFSGNYWYYYNLNYVGLPLAQSYYDSMVVNLVKKTGLVTTDMSYTWGRQASNSYSAQQDYNGYYTGVQDFQHLSSSAHAVTGYDLKHIVKGFVRLDLPFGKGRAYLAGYGRVVNAIVSGWTVSGLVSYHTGQPFRVGAQRGGDYWPYWGAIYPEFHLAGYTGPFTTKNFRPLPADFNSSTQQLPPGNVYMPTTVASNPDPGVLPPSPNSSGLRCPSEGNENISIMKDFRLGSDGQYRLNFRTDFFNAFNRHYYYINGCYGSQSTIGTPDWGRIWSVNDNPRSGQFAIRFEF
jgi:hypothetical protein